MFDAIEGRVKGIKWLEEVEIVRIRVEELTQWRRPASLVGENDNELRVVAIEWGKWNLMTNT